MGAHAPPSYHCDWVDLLIDVFRENLLLVGIVLSSLSWWKGEWIGLTLGVSICSVLRRLNVLSDKFSLADNSNNNGLSSNSLGK